MDLDVFSSFDEACVGGDEELWNGGKRRIEIEAGKLPSQG